MRERKGDSVHDCIMNTPMIFSNNIRKTLAVNKIKEG